MTTLDSRTSGHNRMGGWFFLLSFIIGNLSLLMGANDQGATVGTAGFIVACGVWWMAYRLGGMKSRIGIFLGLLALSIWTLNSLVMIFRFRTYFVGYFLWISSICVVTLLVAFIVSEAHSSAKQPS